MAINPKVTIWLSHAGIWDTDLSGNFNIELARKAVPRYVVKKTQNTMHPKLGAYLRDTEVQALIDSKCTVNIG